ncbi:MAG TPA: hypothetical protein DCS93_30705 [Microscillaceae bacterium]|nr:hypothetical protein [Microscillaceae bacterium]
MQIPINIAKPWTILAGALVCWLLCASQARGQSHPDARYPIPELYSSVNEEGINLATGDLNLEMPLASVQGRQLGYSLSVFYNSRSVSGDVASENNELAGNGWKLLDYPKVVQDGTNYYYLDGKRSFLLHKNPDNSYSLAAPYYLWKLVFQNNVWHITTEEGTIFHLGNTSIEGTYQFWHLQQMQSPNFGDQLNFTYENGQLTQIESPLGQKVVLIYANNYLTKVQNYEQEVLRHSLQIAYGSQGISSLHSTQPLVTGLMEASPDTKFFYSVAGRLNKLVNGAGSVRTYTYYTGVNHPEIMGKVIRYGTDNGYREVTKDGKTPSGGDLDASYSAIWYDLGNENPTGVYTYFNKVRVYPGGFREGTDINQVYNPFGHRTYYIFNGKAKGDLSNVPSDYGATDLTNDALRGMVYQVEQYSNATQSEEAKDRISQEQSIYELRDFSIFKVPLLTKSRQSKDQVEDQETVYQYESTYWLPTETIMSRRNPKKDNPNYKEYTKTWQRYAFQDYGVLANQRQLTAVSQQYNATAAYAGNTLPTDPGLTWEITSGSVQRWKAWTGGWANLDQYVLKEESTLNSFPLNLSNVPDANFWLKTNETTQRNAFGFGVVNLNTEGLINSVLYDQAYQTYPVAQFYNANAATGEAGYFGFESYENPQGWTLTGGQTSTIDAHTGAKAYRGNVSIQYTGFAPKAGEQYIIGAFVKLQGSTAGKLGFKNGANWAQSVAIPTNKPNEWQYVSLVANALGSGDLPSIECTNCLVDDIRVHPLKTPFSATVYQDNRANDDNLTVINAGTYQANMNITVKAGTQVNNGQALVVQAGQRIVFETGVNIDLTNKPEARLDASIGNFALEMNKPVASLGDNGETQRMVYSALEEPIASVGPDEQLRKLSLGYSSRKGIEIFGDSDPNDRYFDQNNPNAGLQITAREGGFWENFRSANTSYFGTLQNMQIRNQRLVSIGNGAATLSQIITDNDFALYVEALPNGLGGNQKMGVDVGQVRVDITAHNIALYENDALVSQDVVALRQLPNHLNLLLVVMDNKHLFVYANGRFLFDHTFAQNIQGQAQLFATSEGSAFANFMYISDPLIGKKTFDAIGQPKQTLVQHSPEQLLVSETLYGDHLNLPMASTRATHIATGTGEDERGLKFRDNFANLTLTNNGTGVTADGEVNAAYQSDKAFTATKNYDQDPSQRADRTGGGGQFAVGTGNATQYNYTANQTNNVFGFGNDQFSKTVVNAPFVENKMVNSTTYQGISTGATFASQITDPLSQQNRREQMVYDQQMRLRQHYQPNAFVKSGNFYTENDYNFLGSVVRHRDPDGGEVQMAYDKVQRRRVLLDAEDVQNGYLKYWKYDVLGRVIEEGIYEDAAFINQSLNTSGSTTINQTVAGVLTVNGNQTGKALHLQAGERIEFIAGFSYEAQSNYTLKANIATNALQTNLQTQVNNASWPATNDAKRKVKRIYTYDQDSFNQSNIAVGRLVQVTTYEEAGNAQKSYNVERYNYDLQGNVIKTERDLIDPSLGEGGLEYLSVFEYTYNLLNQPIQIIQQAQHSQNGASYEVTYTYDRLGRIHSIGNLADPAYFALYTYKNGKTIERLSKAAAGYALVRTDTTNQEGLLQKIAYAKSGGGNLMEEQLYYTQRKNGQKGYFNGNIASIGFNANNIQRDLEYSYDGFGQLTKVEGGNEGNRDYTYDLNGNIESFQKSDKTYGYKTGTNQLQTTSNPSRTLSHDLNGRVTSTGTIASITYDRFTGLTQSMTPTSGDVLKFSYGVHDQRVKKTVGNNAKTIFYAHGLNAYPLIEEIKEGNTTRLMTYVYSSHGIVAMQQTVVGVSRSNVATATMESEFADKEANMLGFEHLNATRTATLSNIDHTRLPANLSPEVARLNGGKGISKGPGKWIKVAPGDKIKAEVFVKYLRQDQAKGSGDPLANALPNAGNGSTTTLVDGIPTITNAVNPANALWQMLTSNSAEEGKAPKASLNYYLFDENMQPLDQGLASVTTAAAITAATLAQPHEKLTLEIPVTQPGYVYVNVSHEEKENTDVFFDDFTIAQTSATPQGWYYYLKDHLGSTRVIADAQGNAVAHYDYEAFGGLVKNQPLAGLEARYLYTGQEYEPELAVYNYRARVYDPALGRFLAPDPLGQQNSAYAYVGNNPVSNIDPMGMWSWRSFAMGVIGVAEVAAGVGLNIVGAGLDATGVGAAVGIGLNTAGAALIGAGINSATSAVKGDSWKEFGIGQATGAVGGVVGAATGGAATAAINSGSVAGAIGYSALSGGASSAASKLIENALRGNGLADGLAGATIGGAIQGGVIGGAKVGWRNYNQWNVNRSNQMAARLLPGCHGCFVKGTLVKTPQGDKPIEAIKPGDQVWAYDKTTGKNVLSKVARNFALVREATYTLHFGTEKIITTSDHPFYNGKKWVKASKLQVGSTVQLINGQLTKVTTIEFKKGDVQVYNFEVAGLHNYYVGRIGLLVHNCNGNGRQAAIDATSRFPRGTAGHTVHHTVSGATNAVERLGVHREFASGGVGAFYQTDRMQNLFAQPASRGVFDEIDREEVEFFRNNPDRATQIAGGIVPRGFRSAVLTGMSWFF